MVKTVGRSLSLPILIAGAGAALVMLWTLSAFHASPTASSVRKMMMSQEQDGAAMPDCAGVALGYDPVDRTFYDDQNLTYMVGSPVENWDEKRREWLKHHPSFARGAENRIFMLTGSQPGPCKNPRGDHLNLRMFKNKVDYCRIHGYDIFYNNAFLHPQMGSWWAKVPAVRAMMTAHPEAEWIFWIDSDAIFTDMYFKLPLEKYKDHNLVVDGWPFLITQMKSWVGLNAGVFLIRNCQWSMEFIEAWAEMGPQTPNYENWGKIQMETLSYKPEPISDDQSGIVYLLLKDKKWANKIYIETQYELSGFWKDTANSFGKIDGNYVRIEKMVEELRRRHAEKVSEHTTEVIAEAFRKEGGGDRALMRPFTTHFTGCNPCNGWHTTEDECWIEMDRALNFADNQVLRNYGFVRPNYLLNSSSLRPLPYGYSSYREEI